MPKILPTRGRLIHYYPAANDPELELDLHDPFAAVIAKINDPYGKTTINVAVFNDQGVPIARQYVPISDQPLAGHFAAWMPYQVGQAAKTDDAAAALSKVMQDLGSRLSAIEDRLGRGEAGSPKGGDDLAGRLEARIKLLEERNERHDEVFAGTSPAPIKVVEADRTD